MVDSLILKSEGVALENMNKVELLAPAGNYESAIGAIHAGADALYLGGEKFGARAYAQNFTTEELCKVLDYAHLNGKKVYLTINTMMKDSEMGQLYEYIRPFYEYGLDGAIIQDAGVFLFLAKNFPDLELHISTQAGLSGEYGAAYWKEKGASRIVPARELSLEEIRTIKKNVNIEVETFIHGAMCYCYSGQCLFSSILGGRSGNRGRCAGPCRLPYSMVSSESALEGNSNRAMCGKQADEYPLSLKDMCTIELIPQLIEAGIDSFKIEGRMKKPEYAAGVTAIYRKYIDLYYQVGKANYFVDSKDLVKLKSLYLRSQLQDGYYHRHNGREMISLNNPGYGTVSEELCENIRRQYLTQVKKKPVSMHMKAVVGLPMELTLCCEEVSVTVSEGMVLEALKQPMNQTAIEEKMGKLGDTFFRLECFTLESQGAIFIPVKALNEIRRKAVCRLMEELCIRRVINDNSRINENKIIEDLGQSTLDVYKQNKAHNLSVNIYSLNQLDAIKEFAHRLRILDIECVAIHKLQMDKDIRRIKDFINQTGIKIRLCMPHLFRGKDIDLISQILRAFTWNELEGVWVRNYESFAFIQRHFPELPIYLDAGLAPWNKWSYSFFKNQCAGFAYGLELNKGEKRDLCMEDAEQIIYGRIPMMVSANCFFKTQSNCFGKFHNVNENTGLYIDRMNKEFKVSIFCDYCYNIIWNSIPLSLHNYWKNYKDKCVRICFTTEENQVCKKILQEYIAFMDGGTFRDSVLGDYTAGHEKRGVE